jgi:hypothetical protein
LDRQNLNVSVADVRVEYQVKLMDFTKRLDRMERIATRGEQPAQDSVGPGHAGFKK